MVCRTPIDFLVFIPRCLCPCSTLLLFCVDVTTFSWGRSKMANKILTGRTDLWFLDTASLKKRFKSTTYCTMMAVELLFHYCVSFLIILSTWTYDVYISPNLRYIRASAGKLLFGESVFDVTFSFVRNVSNILQYFGYRALPF